MKPILTSLILLLTAGLFPQAAATQELSKELRSQIGDFLNETARKEISVGKIHIDSVNTEGNDLILFANIFPSVQTMLAKFIKASKHYSLQS